MFIKQLWYIVFYVILRMGRWNGDGIFTSFADAFVCPISKQKPEDDQVVKNNNEIYNQV